MLSNLPISSLNAKKRILVYKDEFNVFLKNYKYQLLINNSIKEEEEK